MSTKLIGSAPKPESLTLTDARRRRVAVITAEWNSRITHALRDGAVERLLDVGVPERNIEQISVPGAIELVNAAAMVMNRPVAPDAVIVIGCVIRGDTPHFDYVCKSVTEGVTSLNLRGRSPVIFCLLTVNDLQQALDRAGGPAGHKGIEAAEAAAVMINLHA